MISARAAAPGGTFVLRRENPAICPQCGSPVSALWTFISDLTPTILRPVSCEACAGTHSEQQ